MTSTSSSSSRCTEDVRQPFPLVSVGRETSVEPEILPVRLRRIVNGIVTACVRQRELRRRQVKTIQLVAGHGPLVPRVIDDELAGAEVERGLFEEQVERVAALSGRP